MEVKLSVVARTRSSRFGELRLTIAGFRRKFFLGVRFQEFGVLKFYVVCEMNF